MVVNFFSFFYTAKVPLIFINIAPEGDNNKFCFTFLYRLKNKGRAITIAVTITITLNENGEQCRKEAMNQ